MSDIIDILVWVGFAYILFIFLRGMNENQVEKHKKKLQEADEKKKHNQKSEKEQK